MKLLNQTQYWFLLTAAPIFALAGVGMYFALNAVFQDFAEEKMEGVKTEIEAFVGIHDTLPVFFQSTDDRLEISPLTQSAGSIPIRFSDTLIYNQIEDEKEPFRRLLFPVRMKGKWVGVSILQSSIEQEDLATTIAMLLTGLFALLFGVLIWVNRRVSRRVWQPFFATLDQMRRFRLNDAAPLRLGETPVNEFRELHQTLEELADQVQRDFRTVKQFTENASHELQTPLAVIQNKVDMLLQDEAFNERQLQQLNIIGQSARRMARLNQNLLLLAKIENDQFEERRAVDLKLLLEKRLAWLEDFIAEKQLSVTTELHPVQLKINPFLADTLVTNLLTNAVKYNLGAGTLRIELDSNQLFVINSGEAPELPVSKLTQRFTRGNNQSEGLGLGLAMVKEICEKNGLGFELGFHGGAWRVTEMFNAPSIMAQHPGI